MSVHLRRPDTRAMLASIGMSRHSALGAARAIFRTRPLSITGQAAALAFGSGLIGLAVALLVEARFGLAPHDVLASGLSRRSGLTLGQAGWILAAVLFLIATFFGRPPSPWGIAFIFLNGLAIDAAGGILQHPSSMLVRVLFVPSGILVMAAGVAVVLYSGTTGGPFELLMAAGEDRGVSRLTVRYCLDIGVLVVGLLLGGAFGPATIVYALLMGLSIVTISQAIADHRHGRSERLGGREPGIGNPSLQLPSQPVHEVPALLHSRR